MYFIRYPGREMKPEVKINFSDFWDDFNINDNFITDALNKHFKPVISDNPDFVFCATFGRRHLKYTCAKIFFTGENLCPDFNLVDYAMGFHQISFNDRYLRLPLYVLYEDACKQALNKHLNITQDMAQRKFCNYVISNAISDPSRARMIEILNGYKSVDSGGKYKNNVGGPVPDKIEFEKKYKFTMCFENTGALGYTTEKLVEAFAGQGVPIYWGNPDIAKEFNSKAFINCHDFDSFEQVLEEIKRIDEDDEAYLEMLRSPMIGDEGSDLEAGKVLSENYLSDYLYNICSQEPTQAIRRNRIYQGLRYEQQAAFHQKIDNLLYIPKRALYFIQNKIRQ